MPAGAERAVRLNRDIVLLALLEQFLAVLERAELHLIHDGPDLGHRHHLVELGHAEVRDADRARIAGLFRALHSRPGPRRAALRPVDDVQVDLVEAEPLETALRLGFRIVVARIELRGDEDLPARHAAVAKRTTDALLVPVCLRGIDVAVAELERPANRILRLGPVRDLPDAEGEERDLVAVGEYAGPSI